MFWSNRQINIVVSTALISCALSLPAWTQVHKQQAAHKNPIQVKPGQYHRNPKEFISVKLRQLPDLPDFPAYNKYATRLYLGIELPNVSSGKVYDIKFSTRDKRKKVYDWYHDALASSGWQINSNISNASMIMAKKNYNECTLLVMNPTIKGYGADVHVLYKIGNGN